jgi:hypothetical protein
MSYTTNDFIYISTELTGEESIKIVTFEYMNFLYYVRCFENIIQFIKGQRHSELLTNGEVPTPEQHIEHDLRRELYNGDRQPLQEWIDTNGY